MSLPKAIDNLIAELGKLPGIGRRSAERLAFALLNGGTESANSLAASIQTLHQQIGQCDTCGYFTENNICPLCNDPARDRHLLCVVEHALDVVAFERAGGYRGLFHVLGGSLSPLKGIAPEDLSFPQLQQRTKGGNFAEIILATSPSVEGDVTALYASDLLASEQISITRIGRGIPMGGSLELADSGTLRMALEGRRKF